MNQEYKNFYLYFNFSKLTRNYILKYTIIILADNGTNVINFEQKYRIK